MTERQTRMEKLEERSEGGTSLVRLWCKIIQSCWCTFHSVTSFRCLNDASALFMSICVFLLRFLQVVEEEAELSPSRPSSGVARKCDRSWRTVIRSSSSASGKPNSSFCRAAAWRSFAPKENSGCMKWWDLALVVAATRKERWGRNFEESIRTIPLPLFSGARKQDGQHYIHKTSVCMRLENEWRELNSFTETAVSCTCHLFICIKRDVSGSTEALSAAVVAECPLLQKIISPVVS